MDKRDEVAERSAQRTDTLFKRIFRLLEATKNEFPGLVRESGIEDEFDVHPDFPREEPKK